MEEFQDLENRGNTIYSKYLKGMDQTKNKFMAIKYKAKQRIEDKREREYQEIEKKKQVKLNEDNAIAEYQKEISNLGAQEGENV